MRSRWLVASLCVQACALAPVPDVEVVRLAPGPLAPASLDGAVAALALERAVQRGPEGEPMPAAVAIGWAEVIRSAAGAPLPPGPQEVDTGPAVALRERLGELLVDDLAHYGDVPVHLAEAMVALAHRIASLRRAPPALDWPTDPVEVSSSWGARVHPLSGNDAFHGGVDLVAAVGQPVRAAADGEVLFAGRHGGHGNHVELAHGGRARTSYSHLSRLLVRAGQRVQRGQLIGLAGATGATTGPHLHFEAFIDGVPVDPERVVGTAGR